jgi:hypothetical protein
MNNPDRRYLLRIHTLDLPCRGDLIPVLKGFQTNPNGEIRLFVKPYRLLFYEEYRLVV